MDNDTMVKKRPDWYEHASAAERSEIEALETIIEHSRIAAKAASERREHIANRLRERKRWADDKAGMSAKGRARRARVPADAFAPCDECDISFPCAKQRKCFRKPVMLRSPITRLISP